MKEKKAGLPIVHSREGKSQTTSNDKPDYIIGVGASAGGLEALEKLVSHLPADSKLALVVVSHLLPAYKDILAELLQLKTDWPVSQILSNTRVLAHHIYINPPNKKVTIEQGVLKLHDLSDTADRHVPIDAFLSSLAMDQKANAVSVILSGMGSDGTKGSADIKRESGSVFAQLPETAMFDSMPNHVIEAKLVDRVAFPEQLPEEIASFLALRKASDQGEDSEISEQLDKRKNQELTRILTELKRQTKQDFTQYKNSTVFRRVQRRMEIYQLVDMADYTELLVQNRTEAELLFKELLIGVTQFFRDEEVWASVKRDVIPELLNQHPDGGEIRVWIPACSTGEEVYSLAMIFQEVLLELQPRVLYSLKVFASDIDSQSIAVARRGHFSLDIDSWVSNQRLGRFFEKENHGYRIKKTIREMVVFAEHNLLVDPPFTRIDLLSCRNLLIYLESEAQNRCLSLFHYSLNVGGFLILGSAETTGKSSELFKPLSGLPHIYQKLDVPTKSTVTNFYSNHQLRVAPHTFEPSTKGHTLKTIQSLVEFLILSQFAPPAVLTTVSGDILYISGKTGDYLEPAVGRANLNLFAMAREGLIGPLKQSFLKAARNKRSVIMRGLEVEIDSGKRVDITVQPLKEPKQLNGMFFVVFRNSDCLLKSPSKIIDTIEPEQMSHIEGLKATLRFTQEELQQSYEERQASEEDFSTINEELQSTNEELQSTNEELTTSKEEMQSINEEIQTVNQELQAKVSQLTQANGDMKNLLNSTDIATLFLDGELNIRRFTDQTAEIFKLISTDIGRPISDLTSVLDYADLIKDASNVLSSLTSIEKEASTTDHRWYRIRIMPYRTQDNRIDGVVITFVNTTESKDYKTALEDALSVLNRMTSPENKGEQTDRAFKRDLESLKKVVEEGLMRKH